MDLPKNSFLQRIPYVMMAAIKQITQKKSFNKNMSDETLEQFPERDAILKAIDDLGKSLTEKIDNLEKTNNIQFEAIRRGIA